MITPSQIDALLARTYGDLWTTPSAWSGVSLDGSEPLPRPAAVPDADAEVRAAQRAARTAPTARAKQQGGLT